MKNIFCTLLVLCVLGVSNLMAQTKTVSIAKTDKLPEFSRIDISGAIDVKIVHVLQPSELKIVYDTKEELDSRFRVDVDKDNILHVSERIIPQKTARTEVTIYYHNLEKIDIAKATVVFDSPVEEKMLDINLSAGAILHAEVESSDLVLSATGKSSMEIKGRSKYLTINASSSIINASSLASVALDAKIAHNSDVKVAVQERLTVETSTGGKLIYSGNPELKRIYSSLFGGEVKSVN